MVGNFSDVMASLKILIATDNHCGYNEVKKETYDDAFNTLEEVFQQARFNDVDFMIFGGDMFHDNNPSRETRIRVNRIFRKYVLAGEPTELEYLSCAKDNFEHSKFECVNFEDENYCVSMPVFSIHGNHDDLSGTSTSELDSLHEVGLLNLFGRFSNVTKFVLNPILLRKPNADGSYVQVALYGISSQRDDRLARAFTSGAVTFRRPPDAEDYFTILVLHQNRPPRSTSRSTGSYIDAKVLPAFIDLVIWGHEHACIIDPDYVTVGNDDERICILQPGSTVATSLTADEAKQKHCFLLNVVQGDHTIDLRPIPLLTPRALYVEEVNCHERFGPPAQATLRTREKMEDERYLEGRIREIIEDAAAKRNLEQPELPLIRIKMHYTGSWGKVPQVILRKLGQQFVNEVANPFTMVSVARERKHEKVNRLASDQIESARVSATQRIQVDEQVEDIMKLRLDPSADVPANFNDEQEEHNERNPLNVLQFKAMMDAVKAFNKSTSSAPALYKQLQESVNVQMQGQLGVFNAVEDSAMPDVSAEELRDDEPQPRARGRGAAPPPRIHTPDELMFKQYEKQIEKLISTIGSTQTQRSSESTLAQTQTQQNGHSALRQSQTQRDDRSPPLLSLSPQNGEAMAL